MNIFSAGVIDADGDIYPGGLEPGTVIYTADQLAAVVQQRDELLAAAKQALEALGYAWDAARCISAFTTIDAADKALRAAIAKVQP